MAEAQVVLASEWKGIVEAVTIPELERICLRIENMAKTLCPVDTGRLRASITHEVGKEGNELVGRIGTNVEYAPYVELGTRYMAARSFLRQALAAASG